jgi:hypothetical protein
MAEGLQETPNLVVLALVQPHFDPGVLGGLDDPRAVESQALSVDHQSALGPGQGFHRRSALDLGVIAALNLVTRMGDAFGERAVVGEQDEAFGGVVETAHRIEPGELRHQIHHRGAAFRIGASGDDALGLVEQQVHALHGGLDPLAIHANGIGGGVGFGPECFHGHPIDAHAPLGDEFFGGPARGEAGAGEDFLQAFHHGLCSLEPQESDLSGLESLPASPSGASAAAAASASARARAAASVISAASTVESNAMSR